MVKRVRFFKRLVIDLPKYGKLAYCLLRDPRVPARNKALFGTAMGLILTPFVDIPAIVPVLGELDVLALSLVALRLFIAAAPDDIREEHEQAIIEQRSRFDEDLRRGEGLAVHFAQRFRGHEEDGDSTPPAPPRSQETMSA